MAKSKEIFVCENCGLESAKWLGRCPSCSEWNTFKQFRQASHKTDLASTPAKATVRLNELHESDFARIQTGIEELDRTLGGGFVPGEVVLIAGEPGIGKSTLLLQVAHAVLINKPDFKTLYIAGEESPTQIKGRATRLGVKGENILIAQETVLENIREVIMRETPMLVIVDSIQTIRSEAVASYAGSPLQIRETAASLTLMAEEMGFILLIVGHITKGGLIAGPKILEHVVDAVLYLEGDNLHALRLLRVYKNRFGSAQEMGVFSMVESGLEEVANPSSIFLETHSDKEPGSVITPIINGDRCFLVEIQALTAPTPFPVPKRAASGLDINRVNLILAVIANKLKLNLAGIDVYVSAAGGIKVTDVGADLGIALAVLSSMRAQNLDGIAAYGEIGLAGELRKVSLSDTREKEAKKLGYERIVGPGTFRSLKEVVEKVFNK